MATSGVMVHEGGEGGRDADRTYQAETQMCACRRPLPESGTIDKWSAGGECVLGGMPIKAVSKAPMQCQVRKRKGKRVLS